MRIKQVAIVSLLAVSVAACSNFSAGNLFSHYSMQNNALYQDVYSGQYQQAQQLVEPDGYALAGDILDNMERGRVALLNDDNALSRDWLGESDKAVKRQQDKALISLSENANSLSGLIVNDNLRDYSPADYELGFLHLYLALTYVRDNRLDDALVEFRLANKVQERARQIREASLKQESDEFDQQGMSADVASVLANYPAPSAKLSAVQNSYLFFLSGLMFEADGNLNDAYIDYKRALAVEPDNDTVAESTIRCARKLGMKNDLHSLTQRYGATHSPEPGQSRIIIIQEQGAVDYLLGWKQSLMLFDRLGRGALFTFSLPYYPEQQASAFSPLRLNDEQLSGNLLTDVNLMARNQLQERIMSILFRQSVRVVLKEQIRQEVSKGDQVSGLFVNVWNSLTDQPDTRSWMTLPAQIYSAVQRTKSGEQMLLIGGREYRFNAPEQGTTLVWISRQGNSSVVWHKQLGEL